MAEKRKTKKEPVTEPIVQEESVPEVTVLPAPLQDEPMIVTLPAPLQDEPKVALLSAVTQRKEIPVIRYEITNKTGSWVPCSIWRNGVEVQYRMTPYGQITVEKLTKSIRELSNKQILKFSEIREG